MLVCLSYTATTINSKLKSYNIVVYMQTNFAKCGFSLCEE